MDSATPQAPAPDFFGGLGLKIYRYRALIRRQWWILALTIGAGLALEGWMAFKQRQLYSSQSELSIRQQLNLQEDSFKFQQELTTFVANTKAMLTGPEVTERASRRVALENPNLKGETPRVEANDIPHSTIFQLKGTGTSAEYTQRFVDAVATEFIDFRREQESGVIGSVSKGITTERTQQQKDLNEASAALQAFISENNMPFWTEQIKSRANFLSGLKNRQAELQTELQRLQNLTPDQLLVAPPPAVTKSKTNGGDDSGTNHDSSFSGELYPLYVQRIQELSQAQAKLDERSKVWKPKHPRLQELQRELEQAQRAVDVLKDQNKEIVAKRIEAIKAELLSLETSIGDWNKRVLEASEKDAKFQALQQNVDHVKAVLEKTDGRKESIGGSLPDILIILSPASPAAPVPKATATKLLTGAMGGLVIGIIILALFDRADDRIASSTEVMERFDEAILGQIPNVADSRGAAGLPLLQPEDERFTYAEAFRSLRSSLIFMPNQGDLRTLLVTSAIPNEGKSTVASNLAITMSAAGARVVLVDADLRRGDLAALFDADGRTGLSNILRGDVTWQSAVKRTPYPSLSLIPRGPVTNQSGELLLLPSLDALLDDLKNNFDLIVFNTAPILATDDTPTLAPHFEGTLMIVRAQFTSSRLTQNALSALYQRQVNVLGLILNCVDAEMPDYYYYRYPKYYAA